MDKSLSPRDAAERLGITTDTLRRWERDGLIESERTPGGQRRYREQEVSALLDGDRPTRITDSRQRSTFPQTVANREEPETHAAPLPELPSWERRVREEAADLEVTKLRREKAALIRAEREEQEERERKEARRKQEFAERQGEAETLAKAEAAERERLATLRRYGHALVIASPPEYPKLKLRATSSPL